MCSTTANSSFVETSRLSCTIFKICQKSQIFPIPGAFSTHVGGDFIGISSVSLAAENYSLWISCGIVSVITCLVASMKHWLVTDG